MPSDADRFLLCPLALPENVLIGLNCILVGVSNNDSVSKAGDSPWPLCSSQNSSRTSVLVVSLMSSLQQLELVFHPCRSRYLGVVLCQLFQPLSMFPSPPKPSITQRHHNPNRYHPRVPRLLGGGRINECAEASMVIMNEIYQVLLDGMQSRWQTLVFYHTLELYSWQRPLPSNRIARLDVEIDEEER